MAGPEVERELRALPGVVACSVRDRRAHVLCHAGEDDRAIRRAARMAAPGYRVTVLQPRHRHRGPVASVLGEVVPVMVAAAVAVGTAGLGAYALSRALTPDGPAPAPPVAVELPPPPSGRTVVPAPAGETAVLGEVLEADTSQSDARPRFAVAP